MCRRVQWREENEKLSSGPKRKRREGVGIGNIDGYVWERVVIPDQEIMFVVLLKKGMYTAARAGCIARGSMDPMMLHPEIKRWTEGAHKAILLFTGKGGGRRDNPYPLSNIVGGNKGIIQGGGKTR